MNFFSQAHKEEGEIIGLVRWWEKRRLRYNLFVGGTGLILLLLSYPVVAAYPIRTAIETITYGIAANVFYTLGWVSGILKVVYFGGQAGKYREVLFILGTVGSVLLTVFLAAFVFTMWMLDLP